MGTREPKEESNKPMRIIRNGKQVKMSWRSPKKGISKWGWCKGQQTPKVKNMVIGQGKPKEMNYCKWILINPPLDYFLLMLTLAIRPNNKKKPNNIEGNKEEELAKWEKRPLSPNSRNNDPRVYGIVKKALKKANEHKGA